MYRQFHSTVRALGAALTLVGTGAVSGVLVSATSATASGAATPATSAAGQSIFVGNQFDTQGKGGLGVFASTATGNVAPSPAFTVGAHSAADLTFDAAGDLWAASTEGQTVDEYTAAQLLVGGGLTPHIIISGFHSVSGVAFNKAGDLWVSQYQDNKVSEFTPAQLAVSGSPTPGVVISTDATHSLTWPLDMVFDSAGDLWVANADSDTLVRYSPSQLTASGSPTPGVTLSQHTTDFVSPDGLAIDAAGNLWADNYDNDMVVEFSAGAITATGSPAPAKTLSYGYTGGQMAFDAAGDLWLTQTTQTTAATHAAVIEYTPAQLAAGGSPTPHQVITGSHTGLLEPTGLAISAPVAPATGYDMVGTDGGVFVFDAPGQTGGFFGSLPGLHVVPNTPVIGIVPTKDDDGYFLVATDGGVFSFGNAPFLGSLPGIHVRPTVTIVGIVATNTDKGYLLVGADGGVFAFGTAPFLGSLPSRGITVDDSVFGIAATPSGDGYWVVTVTGTVYAFGTAQAFPNNLAATPTTFITNIAGTATGGGYWLVGITGDVYPFGNAKSFGTLPKLHVTPSLPVIAIVPTSGTTGYWLIGLDGGIYAFGTAPFYGSLPGLGVHVTNIIGAVPN